MYSRKLEDVIHQLNTDIAKGLNSDQVQERLKEYGENKLQEGKKKSILQRFLDQFKDVLIIILLIAAAISFFVALIEGNPSDFLNPFLYC